MRNTPAKVSSKANMMLPWCSALPSRRSDTSTSESASGRASTLIWMPICGCWPGISDCGAFGSSNEKSLTYCASTLSCGAGASAGPPLVVDMKTPDAMRRFANTGPRSEQGRRPCEELTPVALDAAIRLFGIGYAAPLLRLKIDHAVRRARGLSPQAGQAEQRPAQRCDKKCHADRVGDEPRDQQQDAGEHDDAAGGIGLEGAEITVRHCDANAGNVAAAGMAQQHRAGNRAEQNEAAGRTTPDCDRHRDEHRQFHQRQQQQEFQEPARNLHRFPRVGPAYCGGPRVLATVPQIV